MPRIITTEKRIVIHAPLKPRLKELVEERCEALGMTIAEYIRWLIREDLRRAGLLEYGRSD